jgi:hypothetical protein
VDALVHQVALFIPFLTLIIEVDNKLVLFLIQVSPGTKTILDQDVVAINTAKKNYSVVGKVTVDAKAVVTPDIDAIDLESIGL